MTTSSTTHASALPPTPAEARHELKALLESKGWRGDIEGVLLAVHEALINSQRHGGGVTSASAAVEGRAVTVEVRDHGPGFNVDRHAHQAPDPLAEHGRGLWLISRIADSWDVRRRGDETCLCLRFCS